MINSSYTLIHKSPGSKLCDSNIKRTQLVLTKLLIKGKESHQDGLILQSQVLKTVTPFTLYKTLNPLT